jgi:segregation and condensation protein B
MSVALKALQTSDAEEQDALDARSRRIIEALLFASADPMSIDDFAARCPVGADIGAILSELAVEFATRGVNLVQVAGRWSFRTAPDLGYLLQAQVQEPRKLSRAALETLAIIAYHQPVTRAEIEEIRGVATSKGTLDLLLETGWVRLRGRRRSPGRPVTYGTTPAFLGQFGLDRVDDLPGLDELKGSGFIEGQLSKNLTVPIPTDSDELGPDEDPLEDLFAPLDEPGAEPHTERD